MRKPPSKPSSLSILKTVVMPYIIKTICDGKFGSLEDVYAISSLLGDLIIRFPGESAI